MDLPGCGRVEPGQETMQVARRPLLFSALAQPLAQLLRPLRTGEQAFQQGTQIKTGPADHNRQSSPRPDLLKDFTGLASVLASRDEAVWVHDIEHVVRHAGPLSCGRLCGPNLKLAIHGHGIAVYDLTMEAFGQRQGKRSLPASSRTKYHNQ